LYIGTACSYPAHLQSNYELIYLKENQTYPANPESASGWSRLMGEYEAAIDKLILTGTNKGVIPIGSGEGTSVRQIAEKIKNIRQRFSDSI
jgi:hypothetical protein